MEGVEAAAPPTPFNRTTTAIAPKHEPTAPRVASPPLQQERELPAWKRQILQQLHHNYAVQMKPFLSFVQSYRSMQQQNMELQQRLELMAKALEERQKQSEVLSSAEAKLLQEKIRQLEEELKVKNELVYEKDAELRQSYKQNAEQSMSLFTYSQENARLVQQHQQLEKELNAMQESYNDLQKQNLDTQRVDKVLRDEVMQLKAQREALEQQLMEQTNARIEIEKELINVHELEETWRETVRRNAELINRGNLETQALLRENNELRQVILRLQHQQQSNRRSSVPRRKQSVPTDSTTNAGGGSASSAQPSLEGNANGSVRGSGTFNTFFSSLIDKLKGEVDDSGGGGEWGDEDEDEMLAGFSFLSGDVPPKGLKKSLVAHAEEVTHLKFNFQGFLFATCGSDGVVNIWDATTGNKVNVLRGAKRGITCADFTSGGELVLGASNDKMIYLWNYEQNRTLHTLTGHQGSVSCAKFTIDSRNIVSGSYDRCLKLWDIDKGFCLKTIMCGSKCNDFCFTSRDVICSGHYDKSLRVYDSRTGKTVHESRLHDGQITSICFAPGGERLLTNSRDNTLKILDIRSSFSTVQTLR
ncbi:ATG16 domain-containing protein, variant 4 [Balamuthia mandrillaris]